jgi:hypothetical protein
MYHRGSVSYKMLRVWYVISIYPLLLMTTRYRDHPYLFLSLLEVGKFVSLMRITERMAVTN